MEALQGSIQTISNDLAGLRTEADTAIPGANDKIAGLRTETDTALSNANNRIDDMATRLDQLIPQQDESTRSTFDELATKLNDIIPKQEAAKQELKDLQEAIIEHLNTKIIPIEQQLAKMLDDVNKIQAAQTAQMQQSQVVHQEISALKTATAANIVAPSSGGNTGGTNSISRRKPPI